MRKERRKEDERKEKERRKEVERIEYRRRKEICKMGNSNGKTEGFGE